MPATIGEQRIVYSFARSKYRILKRKQEKMCHSISSIETRIHNRFVLIDFGKLDER